MKFDSPLAMYEYVCEHDIYNAVENRYIFCYNEYNALCCYYISPQDAKALQNQVEVGIAAYWSELLGVGGEIYDGDYAMDLCEQWYQADGWIPCDAYTIEQTTAEE